MSWLSHTPQIPGQRIQFKEKLVSLNGKHKPRASSSGVQATHSSTIHYQTRENNSCFQIQDVATHRPPLEFTGESSLQSHPFSYTDKLALHFCETFRSDLPSGKSLIVIGGFITEVPRHVGSIGPATTP
jgi:hypothetical protein